MGSIQEQKSGSIDVFYDADSGVIKESNTNAPLDFFHPGAQVTFFQGDLVNFVKVTTPSGKIIVREITKSS